MNIRHKLKVRNKHESQIALSRGLKPLLNRCLPRLQREKLWRNNLQPVQDIYDPGSVKVCDGICTAAKVAYAHCACIGISVEFSERLNLHCADKGNQAVCKYIMAVRYKAYEKRISISVKVRAGASVSVPDT